MRKQTWILSAALFLQIFSIGCAAKQVRKAKTNMQHVKMLFSVMPRNPLALSKSKVKEMLEASFKVPNTSRGRYLKGYAMWAYAKHIYAERIAKARNLEELRAHVRNNRNEILDKYIPLLGMSMGYFATTSHPYGQLLYKDVKPEFNAITQLVQRKCKYWGAILKNSCHKPIVKSVELLRNSCRIAKYNHPFYCQ